MRALVVVLLFTFLGSVSSESFIEAQDPSSENNVPDINVKQHDNSGCSGECYFHTQCQSGYYCDNDLCCRPTSQRPCSFSAQCPQGWYCDRSARLCKAFCTSDSACEDSQCCIKASGMCGDLKKPGEWCPVEPNDHYHCGCTEGYECKRYYGNYYWGTCKKKPCSSDSSCQKTHCCSGGQCKPRKKVKEFCPFKGADIYHCGCIEGYTCKQYANNGYWGKCEQIVPPTEEPGSGFEE